MEIQDKYLELQNKKYSFKDYSLVTLRGEDIELIRNWRNEQIDVLRQEKEISKEEQKKYFQTIIKKSFKEKNPNMILFSYILNQECIGYGGLTNIDWNSKNAEISFIVDTVRYRNEKKYTEDFTSFLNIIIDLVFEELDFNRLFTETYDIRPTHLKILEKTGFVLERRMKQHVNIKGKYVDSLIHEYTREKYAKK